MNVNGYSNELDLFYDTFDLLKIFSHLYMKLFQL